VNELQDIAFRYAEARQANRLTALVTVFRVRGSTYRRPGARMLITEDRLVTGCVSGGCLERDVVEQALRVMRTKEPRVLTYDSLAGGDLEEGFGQGCNGCVQVLVEPLDSTGIDHLEFISSNLRGRRPAVVATVVAVEDGEDSKISQRLMVAADEDFVSDIDDPWLRSAVASEARRLVGGRSAIVDYDVASGRITVFFESIVPPLSLVVFGAGHDATPLVRLARNFGWHVLLVEHRPSNLARARGLVPSGCVIHPREITDDGRLTRRSAVVIMNHNFHEDVKAVQMTLSSPASYIGVLGPRLRTESLLEELRAQGETPTDAQLERLYGPVGLDIGADEPNQIALAIVAEVQAVFARCDGGFLRDRVGPLHVRNDDSVEMKSRPVEVHCALD
jgi:xanthine dehydrogenase accessory factor